MDGAMLERGSALGEADRGGKGKRSAWLFEGEVGFI